MTRSPQDCFNQHQRLESREAVIERLVSDGASAEAVEKVKAGLRWEGFVLGEKIFIVFRRRAGPRSVMISREELGYENMSEESGDEADPDSILKLPNGMRYRSVLESSSYFIEWVVNAIDASNTIIGSIWATLLLIKEYPIMQYDGTTHFKWLLH